MAAPIFAPESSILDSAGQSQLELARYLRSNPEYHENPLLMRTTHEARAEHCRVPYTVHSILPIGSTAVKVLVPGFGASKNAYRQLATELAYAGDTAITLKPSRSAHDMHRPQKLLAEEAVAIMKDVYNRYGISEFDEEAHSMGGPAAVAAAETLGRQERGPKVQKVGLVQAAGATHHNMLSLSAHVPEVAWESRSILFHHPELVGEGLLHFYTNLPRTISEMMQVSNCRLTPERLQRLGNLGTSTTALYHAADPFFPAHKAFKELDGAVDVFAFGTSGGHLAPITHAASVAYDIGNIDQALALAA